MAEEPTSAPRPGDAARFEDYAQYVAALQVVKPLEGDPSTFEWQARLQPMGPASLSRAKVSRHRSRRTSRFCARVGLDHIVVYSRLSGHAELQTNATSRLMKPGDVTFMDISRPMSASGPIDTICVGLPRTLIAPLVKDVDGLHALVLSPSTTLGRLAASHLDALSTEIGRMTPMEAGIAADATASLLAVCANGSPVIAEEARVRARPALLVTIRHHIEQHLSDPTLGPEIIARRFALSRSTLYRLFHPFGGIESYIRRRRLARAYRSLAHSSARSSDYIYQVGQAVGFTSASTFSRAFRCEFGLTPRDVALGMVGEDAAAATATACSPDLSECLRDMVFQAV